ncbi:eukaryotic translation initiation factor 3 subunit E [Marasmius crinis-equi]|uniref:Eukaryotic translation initiation factor 3 subunit E n=1 Tax=Marasmius crinis-equi TaxID=585013 RepID=A0ABR3FMV0_9AGAR
MTDHDLSKTIIPYLDRHLTFPLLAHLTETGIFPENEVQVAQYELASGTNMFDYAATLFKQIYPDQEVPTEFDEKRQNVVSTHERLQQEAQAVLDVIENPDVAQSLRQDKNQNLQYLKENYNLTLDQITALYNFGKFQYSYGNYSGAADYLYHFRVLSTDADLNMSAHWGKLACDILSGKWETALEELNTLREAIDSRATSLVGPSGNVDPALSQLHSRTWLVHWSLFVYFNHPQGRALLLETFLSPTYLNTIQTSCPWILRYLAAAAIISTPTPSSNSAPVSSRVKNAVREIVKVIQTEGYQYSDPVTEFLTQLHVEFDFEAAQQELSKAEKVVADDFFLGDFRDEFLESASDLSDRLNLPRDEGEKWIVNLIRETRMGQDAKIDLEKNLIQISRPPQPVYQSVIEKTRGLAIRTQAFGAAVARPGISSNAAAPSQAVTVN